MELTTFTCPRCEGSGRRILGAYTKVDGTKVEAIDLGVCYICKGYATVQVDPDAIREAIKGRKGLRTAKPAPDTFGASYVWRMARFHGGIDTTMPILCYGDVGCGGILTPNARLMLDMLDMLADKAAKKYCGTDMAAAKRWKGLLY